MRAPRHRNGKVWLTTTHFLWRRPGGPLSHSRHVMNPRPGEAWPSDPDPVSPGYTASLDKKQEMVRGVDNDSTRHFGSPVGNRPRQELRRDLRAAHSLDRTPRRAIEVQMDPVF